MMSRMNWRRSATKRDAWGAASQQSVVNNSATPSTTQTVISATTSTLGVTPAQLSSTEGRNVKKQKHKVQHPTIDYPTTASATRANTVTSVPHSLHHQSNWRTMPSTADSMHNVSYTQSQALELPVHQSPQSPRSTSASCRQGCKHTVKMELILQVITSFYWRLEVLILVSYTRVDFHYPHNWLGYETPVSSQVSTKFLIKYKDRISLSP